MFNDSLFTEYLRYKTYKTDKASWNTCQRTAINSTSVTAFIITIAATYISVNNITIANTRPTTLITTNATAASTATAIVITGTTTTATNCY
jgi:hypothetical protein